MRLIATMFMILSAPAIANGTDFGCQVMAAGWYEVNMKIPTLAVFEISNPTDPVRFYLLPDGTLVDQNVYSERLKKDATLEANSIHFLFAAQTTPAADGTEIKYMRVEVYSQLLNGIEKIRRGNSVGWDGVGTSIQETYGDVMMGQGIIKLLGVTCVRKELLHHFSPVKP